MPTPTKGKRLGGSPAHEKAMLANLATALFENGRITTTETKARRLRPFAERLITKARRGDLHARRQVMRVIRDKGVVHVLFTEIGPRFETRPGGYTRITKIGPRKGDNAPMAVIELVEEEMAAAASSGPAATPAPAAATDTGDADEAAAEADVAVTAEGDAEVADTEADTEKGSADAADGADDADADADEAAAEADVAVTAEGDAPEGKQG